jgi:hypothetical protein
VEKKGERIMGGPDTGKRTGDPSFSDALRDAIDTGTKGEGAVADFLHLALASKKDVQKIEEAWERVQEITSAK